MESEQMPTYTVHAPPPRKGAPEPERFLFLRDGFHFWAFVAPPLWLLVYRLWLALLLYLILAGAVVAGLVWLNASATTIVAAVFCISLLMGFEATTIRRWTLARRGWPTLGFAVGETQDAAEQRFFARWAERPQAESTKIENTTPPSPPPRYTARSAPGVIGLFPEPDGTR
jgi:hypothetical protein